MRPPTMITRSPGNASLCSEGSPLIVAGMMPPLSGGFPAYWALYFSVVDADVGVGGGEVGDPGLVAPGAADDEQQREEPE